MPNFKRTLASLGILFAIVSLLSIWFSIQNWNNAWLWLIPLALLVVIILFVTLGLRGSHGGLPAFLAGQFPPGQRTVPRRAHIDLNPQMPELPVEATIDLGHPSGQIAENYLSLAIDLSQVAGGKWWDPKADHIEGSSGSLRAPVFDFDRPQLDRLVQALAPCVVRIGGSESDKIFYALNDDPAIPPGYESMLTRSQVVRILAFCKRNNCRLMFTLNCGPAARLPGGKWNSTNAEALMAFIAQQEKQVDFWELGNELNVFFFVHGLNNHIPIPQYAADLQVLRALIHRHSPGSLLAGQGSAVWPVLGEPLAHFFGYTEGMLKQAGKLLDLITWHYYPQQSRRCPFGSRRAHPARLLEAGNLDEIAHWAKKINHLRDQFAPNRPVWLGETGNAQCGGAPGLSETYLAGLWWLDELGLMARLNQQVVVRQSLTGMNYGLLDEETLAPRPDYWNSLLWRKLMGRTIFPVTGDTDDKVRIYAHSNPGGDGFTVLVINLHHQEAIRLKLPQASGRHATQYILSSPDILGGKVLLNGIELGVDGDGNLPQLTGAPASAQDGMRLPPLAYGFWVFQN